MLGNTWIHLSYNHSPLLIRFISFPQVQLNTAWRTGFSIKDHSLLFSSPQEDNDRTQNKSFNFCESFFCGKGKYIFSDLLIFQLLLSVLSVAVENLSLSFLFWAICTDTQMRKLSFFVYKMLLTYGVTFLRREGKNRMGIKFPGLPAPNTKHKRGEKMKGTVAWLVDPHEMTHIALLQSTAWI